MRVADGVPTSRPRPAAATEPLTPERLAEIRDSARRGIDSHAEVRMHRHYLLAEVDHLREQLEKPCGSCHPCTEWSNQTWVNAGKRLPSVQEWQDKLAEVDRLRAQVAAVEALLPEWRQEVAEDEMYLNGPNAHYTECQELPAVISSTRTKIDGLSAALASGDEVQR